MHGSSYTCLIPDDEYNFQVPSAKDTSTDHRFFLLRHCSDVFVEFTLLTTFLPTEMPISLQRFPGGFVPEVLVESVDASLVSEALKRVDPEFCNINSFGLGCPSSARKQPASSPVSFLQIHEDSFSCNCH